MDHYTDLNRSSSFGKTGARNTKSMNANQETKNAANIHSNFSFLDVSWFLIIITIGVTQNIIMINNINNGAVNI